MALPSAPFPILTSVDQVRQWHRQQQRLHEQTCSNSNFKLGFVPTMGALHQGHLSLVQQSLKDCDSTIVSIFVNPAQFAPHEDLSTYPRTLESDVKQLNSVSSQSSLNSRDSTHQSSFRKVSALFLPPVEALYPSGITTDVTKQRGTFLEVKGLQEVMEGVSRPGFFRGVATVVIKLFNIVQPDRAYFGQKDIQQAILLRRMLTDLHVSNPLSENLIILPTHRDSNTNLALSSRNAYLKQEERIWSTVLIDALKLGQQEFERMRLLNQGEVDVARVLQVARNHVIEIERRVKDESNDVSVQLLYINMNDPQELYDLEQQQHDDHQETRAVVKKGKGAILSGAVMLGKTRLIDNLVFDYELNKGL
ncbi:pantoate-beta-alanine ligase [Microbotryomycetes sp. JL221]|nr:pantoate-beta-alanine ligase [Microbotryomycetes sp. JL221]